MVNPFQGGGGFGGNSSYAATMPARRARAVAGGIVQDRASGFGGGNPFTGQNAFTGGASPGLANGITPFATAAAGGTTPAGGNVTTPNPYGYQTTGQGGTSTEVDFGSSPYNNWMGNFNKVDCQACMQQCGGMGAGGDGPGGGGDGSGDGPGDGGDGSGDVGGGIGDKSPDEVKKRLKHLHDACKNGNKAACRRRNNIKQGINDGTIADPHGSSSGAAAPGGGAPGGGHKGGGGGHKGGGGGHKGGGGGKKK